MIRVPLGIASALFDARSLPPAASAVLGHLWAISAYELAERTRDGVGWGLRWECRYATFLPDKGAWAMRSKRVNMNTVAVVAVVATFATAGQVDGGTIIPIDQDRYIEAFVCPECELGTIDSDLAKGFSPFSGIVQTSQQCDDILVSATASQQSEIGASSMTAFGSATSEGESPTGIHTYAVSVFEVTFELPAASNLALMV